MRCYTRWPHSISIPYGNRLCNIVRTQISINIPPLSNVPSILIPLSVNSTKWLPPDHVTLKTYLRRIYRSPVNSPHKGQWRGVLMFSLICALNKWFSKQSWGWWFETPLRSLWRHGNEMIYADRSLSRCQRPSKNCSKHYILGKLHTYVR